MAPSIPLCLSFPVSPPSSQCRLHQLYGKHSGSVKRFFLFVFLLNAPERSWYGWTCLLQWPAFEKVPLGTRITVASQKSVHNCCLCTATDGKNMLTKSTVCVCESRRSDLLLPYAPSALQTPSLLLVAVEEKPSQFCSDKWQWLRSIPAICSLTFTSFLQVHSVALSSSLEQGWTGCFKDENARPSGFSCRLRCLLFTDSNLIYYWWEVLNKRKINHLFFSHINVQILFLRWCFTILNLQGFSYW